MEHKQGPPTLGGVLDGFSNAEGEHRLLCQMRGEWAAGGRGRRGIPCPLPSRPPPPRQPFQPSLTPSRASHQEAFQNDEKAGGSGLGPKTLGGPGPKPWAPSPWEPKP